MFDTDPPTRVHGVIWNALTGLSLGYALTEILANQPREEIEPHLWCLRGNIKEPQPFERAALPSLIFRLLCKAQISMASQGRLASVVLRRNIRAGDVVYVWPPYDLSLIRRARDRGAVVIAERTNCMGSTAKGLLTEAYGRRGLPLPDGGFTESEIRNELEQVMACDYVTAPNAFVSQSLLESGVPKERIIETSYGFSPSRLADAILAEKPLRRPVFAFVGLGIVRKGLDVLLEAWELANVDGQLLIGGEVSAELRSAYDRVLSRPDVRELGYVSDVAKIYATADVFVFPTHEEGGPLVTYEAAACGLPSIISPMGAGRIVRDQQEGLLIDPLDVEALASAITSLAEDATLRRQLGSNAAKRADDFTWQKVGRRFSEDIKQVARTH